jgi:hypothetical protein
VANHRSDACTGKESTRPYGTAKIAVRGLFLCPWECQVFADEWLCFSVTGMMRPLV